MPSNRYSTPYYNSERYYDPTAGAAIRNAIRRERKWYDASVLRREEKQESAPEDFPAVFTRFYEKAFGKKADGRSKNMAKRAVISRYVRTYRYCIAHVNDPGFSVEGAAKALGLASDKTVRQVFSETGNIAKVIACYKDWLSSGTFRWHTKERWWTKEEVLGS